MALSDYRSAQRSGRPVSFKAAGAPYGIPESTLRDYERKTQAAIASAPRHSDVQQIIQTAVTTSRVGLHLRLLSDDMETQLMTWIRQCDELAQPPDTVTIRHRDSMEQERVHISELKEKIGYQVAIERILEAI